MENLNRFYEKVGGDAKEIVARLGGNTALVKRFLGKFAQDSSFGDLCNALNENDTETAFRSAHTMKGVCANLGLQKLFEKASHITELLRAGNLEDAKVYLPELTEEYKATLQALTELG